MRAAVYQTFGGAIEVINVPDPTPLPLGVVVKVTATGLCRSDWHGWMGHDADIKLPHVPGHELAGTIEAVGSGVRNFCVGDRITVPFVCGCGTCYQCHSGNHQVCDHQSQPGFTHWGSFAQYVALDYADTNLVKLPPEISNTTAALLGCRFITSFRALTAQGRVAGGQWVAVHGCGGVGLSAVMIATALGAQVIGVDINDEQLQLATQLGAVATINPKNNTNVAEAIQALTGGGAHVSIDALGSAVTCYNSVACLRKRGKHVQVGLMTGNHKNVPLPMDKVLANELEIIGSHGMQAYKFGEMLQMIASGKLQPQKLISATISLQQATTALPNMNDFAHKGVLLINEF